MARQQQPAQLQETHPRNAVSHELGLHFGAISANLKYSGKPPDLD
jgi:hypothetical protein